MSLNWNFGDQFGKSTFTKGKFFNIFNFKLINDLKFLKTLMLHLMNFVKHI